MTTVTKRWPEYHHGTVENFHARVQREFGRLNQRWGFTIQPMPSPWSDFVVDYWFTDPHDATLFALKYLES